MKIQANSRKSLSLKEVRYWAFYASSILERLYAKETNPASLRRIMANNMRPNEKHLEWNLALVYFFGYIINNH